MDMGTFRGVMTAILMAAFIGLVIWTWSRRRTADFEEAAALPLEDESSEDTDRKGP